MKNEKRPGRIVPARGEIFSNGQGKDTPKLTYRQRKVAELLRTGKHSVADISIALHYSDPRSYIRDLRAKGVIIHDEWVENEDTRYKKYWA